MWFAYALRSKKDGWLYIGITADPAGCLEQHNRGYNRSTRSRAPFELFHSEAFATRKEAREREKFLKGGGGRKFLKAKLSD
jgi:putative endonuclease